MPIKYLNRNNNSTAISAGNSVLFNGSNQYLSIANNAAFDFGTGSFTIEGWINPTLIDGTYRCVFSIGNPVQIYARSGTLEIYFNDSDDTLTYIVFAANGPLNAITANTWAHFAVVRNGTTFTAYINGVAGTATTGVSAAVASSSTGVVIGNILNLYPFSGYISNLRILKGTALYTSNFTPSTSPLTAIANTSLLTCKSATIVDNSTNNFTITNNGAATVSSTVPFTASFAPAPGGIAYKNRNSAGTSTPTGNSVQFNGSNQYLSIAAGQGINNFDTENFTIEAWVYFTVVQNGQFVSAGDGSNTNAYYWQYYAGQLQFGKQGIGSITVYGWTPSTNTWYHVAVARSGTTVTQYINGASVSSGTSNVSFVDGPTYIAFGGAGYFNGRISNARIVKGTALYTASFTAPTSPLTAIANTSLLACNAATIVDGSPNISNATGAFPIYNTTSDGSSNTGGTRADTYSSSLVLAIPMNGANNGTTFTDESANIKGSGTAKTITNNGSIPTLTAISKFYGSSAYFSNASAQYIVFGNYGTDFQFTGDFTIECWVYPTTSGATDGSLFVLQSGGSNYFAFNFDPGTQFNIYNNSGGPSWSPSVSSVITGQWNHFALIRSGNTQQIFVNGISIGTNTASGTLGYSSTSADFARIGGGASGAINSYIQDLRVYKGVAKYTANFTPPANANIITNNNSATVSSTTPFTVSTATSTMKMKKVFADPLTYMIATGGDLITTSGSYKIHQFTTVGTSSFVVSSAGSNPNIECLVVAGGGGGGAGTSNTGAGSGGGGGGVIYSSSISLSQTGTYVVVVGNGGIGGSSSGNNGSNGAGSSITGGSVGVALSATGGGYGATNGTNGGSGGSGGGGAPGGASTTTGGTSTSGQGNSGGNGVSGTYYGASGGGATSVGSNSLGGGVGSTPPNGGLGYTSLITGTSVAYSAGGAGGYNGSIGSVINGSNNTGNGGNGGSQQAGTASAGGSGGSGVVVIKYRYTA